MTSTIDGTVVAVLRALARAVTAARRGRRCVRADPAAGAARAVTARSWVLAVAVTAAEAGARLAARRRCNHSGSDRHSRGFQRIADGHSSRAA